MDKLNGDASKVFISEHYKRKGLNSESSDWEVAKKYRNFKGQICRDMINSKLRVRGILIQDPTTDTPFVIENENYEFFLKAVSSAPVFYYVPTICNNGLLYVFTPSNYFDRYNEFPSEFESNRQLLLRKLKTMFKDEDLFNLENSLIFAFPNCDMDDVIRKLELNQLSFNSKLFDKLDPNLFQPIIPDISLSSFKFPEDNNISPEAVIHNIFSVLSYKDTLSNEDYARIKSLLKKVKNEDFNIVRIIASDLRPNDDTKLNAIFDFESNRKKAQELVRRVWLNKIADI